MNLPEGLIKQDRAFPVIHIDLEGMDPERKVTQEMVNETIYTALGQVHPGEISGRALLKVHVGEEKCTTHAKPEYMTGSIRFLREHGARAVVLGDTTVAYSGTRGHKQNSPGNTSGYLKLSERHGWGKDKLAGVPFIILDRPETSIPKQFEFNAEEKVIEADGIKRYRDFFISGGFAEADFVINHAHLTLHGLAGLAGCVKGVAMGCSSLKGKLRMHKALLPFFNSELCVSCGKCVESCPEHSLTLADGNSCPVVDPKSCIGCGECQSVCKENAVTLKGEDIIDWKRGANTLSSRMADYTIGLMSGKWEKTIHILHMYNITEDCDCLNTSQKPIFNRHFGFLVSKNPFAVDRLAARILKSALEKKTWNMHRSILKSEQGEKIASYAEETYGILSNPLLESIKLSK